MPPTLIKNKFWNWVLVSILGLIGAGLFSAAVFSFNFVPKVNYFMQDHEKRVTEIEEDFTTQQYVDDQDDNLNSTIVNLNETFKDFAKENREFNQEILREVYAIKYGNRAANSKLEEIMKTNEETSHAVKPMELKPIIKLDLDSNLVAFPIFSDSIICLLR